MIQTISHQNKIYPKFQSEGFASQFAIPYAKHVCIGKGVDVGCMKEEWSFPGSMIVDPVINGYHALNFPWDNLDYIFSSHCLEHVPDWVNVLLYWSTKLKSKGTLFLYLPDYSQTYWRPWHNKKHVNIFSAQIISDFLKDNDFKNIFTSGVDLNNSFMVMGTKI
jgi:hypothetical protein